MTNERFRHPELVSGSALRWFLDAEINSA